MNWKKRDADRDIIRAISKKYQCDILVATILARRQITKNSEILFFLEKDPRFLHNPFLFKEMEDAVDRILQAAEEKEKVLIFGDRDVDGVTASAIMYRGLREAGAEDVSVRLPEGDEPYGLTMAQVDEILEKGYTLVITVDSGITSIDEIRKLEKNGIDAIVLDHHIPGDSLPPAAAIFDPLVAGSGYPFTGLAGCAVAAKIVWALRFSQTDMYESECILLHAEPRNGTIRIEAARLENLIETDRIVEELVEGAMSIERTRLIDFLAVNLPIFVLDSDTERNMLRKAFGNSVDISLIDIRGRLESVIPSARGRSLFDLAMISRAVRYKDGEKEMETLISLFRSMMFYSSPSISTGFDKYLQLAAIGTIADLMPMKNENRIIVRRGLKLMSERPLECLKPLLGRQNLAGKKLNTRDISFYVAPVLNAAGRMGNPVTALSLLLTDDIREAETITDKLLELNRKRQKNEEEALSMIADKAAASREQLGGKMIIISDERIPRGLTGAIASKLAKQYTSPSIVMAETEERVFASMRCQKGFNARSFLSVFSSFFDDFGGHKFAAGFSMPAENKDKFIEAVSGYALTLDESEENEEIEADAEIPGEYMTEKLWEISQLLEPYGQENEPLQFSIHKAEIAEIYPNKGDSRVLRFAVRYGRFIWPALWWSPDDRDKYSKGMHVDIVFTPDINYWKGQSKLQIIIQAMEINEG